MLARQAGVITILMVDDNSLRTNRVTDNFSNLPLDQGITRLMRDWNYVLTRESKTGRAKLFILGPRGSSQHMPTMARTLKFPIITENEMDTETVKQGSDTTAESSQLPPYMETTLRADLQSSNPEARRMALQKIESTEVGDSTIEDVRRLVQQDPNPEVRAAALDRLILYDPSEEAMQILRNLTTNPDESLRELAVEHLARMQEAKTATENVPQGIED